MIAPRPGRRAPWRGHLQALAEVANSSSDRGASRPAAPTDGVEDTSTNVAIWSQGGGWTIDQDNDEVEWQSGRCVRASMPGEMPRAAVAECWLIYEHPIAIGCSRRSCRRMDAGTKAGVGNHCGNPGADTRRYRMGLDEIGAAPEQPE